MEINTFVIEKLVLIICSNISVQNFSFIHRWQEKGMFTSLSANRKFFSQWRPPHSSPIDPSTSFIRDFPDLITFTPCASHVITLHMRPRITHLEVIPRMVLFLILSSNETSGLKWIHPSQLHQPSNKSDIMITKDLPTGLAMFLLTTTPTRVNKTEIEATVEAR